MRVDTLREVAPGIWFPVKITVVDYDVRAMRLRRRIVAHRTETIIEQVALDPHHDDAFFRNVAIPAGLPVFTIKDRTLVGSALPAPVGSDREPALRAEVIARVAEREKPYDDLEVKSRVSYQSLRRVLAPDSVINDESHEEHSIVLGRRGYFASLQARTTFGGRHSEQLQLSVCDGRWVRTFQQTEPAGRQAATSWASLRRARPRTADDRCDDIPLHRPHTLLKRGEAIYGPLADLLASPWLDKTDYFRIEFRYCGEAEVDGHPCIKVRGDTLARGLKRANSSFVLFLATDRNHIPIRIESYGGDFGGRPMPTGISHCDDFREIAPGVWYPFHFAELAFDNEVAAAQGWIVLDWRRETDITSAILAPRVDEAVFRKVIAPAGVTVQVLDEDGRLLDRSEQAEDGIPSITPAGYLKLLSGANVSPFEQEERRRAIHAMIGRPAPEFSAGAAWLNGPPLTWKALRGKVVILDFWAEWSEPCRGDLARLVRLRQDRAKNGLAIVGIHPPGSEPGAIKKAIDACQLDFPICVDIEPPDGVRAWGDLFGRFAVRAIPHAVAVDAEGNVVACGPLDHVLARAEALVKKGR